MMVRVLFRLCAKRKGQDHQTVEYVPTIMGKIWHVFRKSLEGKAGTANGLGAGMKANISLIFGKLPLTLVNHHCGGTLRESGEHSRTWHKPMDRSNAVIRMYHRTKVVAKARNGCNGVGGWSISRFGLDCYDRDGGVLFSHRNLELLHKQEYQIRMSISVQLEVLRTISWLQPSLERFHLNIFENSGINWKVNKQETSARMSSKE